MADARLVTFLRAEDDSTRERWFADLETASDDDAWWIAHRLARLSWPDGVQAAARAARVLIDPARSTAARVGGHYRLARLAIREGRWRDASRELDAMATVDPIEAVLHRAKWASSLFLLLPQAELSAIRADLAALLEAPPRDRMISLPSGSSPPPSRLAIQGLIRLTALSARLGEVQAAEEYASQYAAMLTPPGGNSGTIFQDVQLILRARILYEQGDLQAAREAVESIRSEGTFNVAAGPHRDWAAFLRAELLYRLGELEEAKHWYSLWTSDHFSHWRYLGPAIYRIGQIHDAMGEPEEARERFEQFVALWEEADQELQPWVQDARDRLAALPR